MVSRVALALVLTLAVSGCASVVIIHRSVPTLADQWRAATTVTLPRDTRKPVIVKE